MTATDELRPCPMCGSTRIKVYTTQSVQSFRRGVVKCLKCGCNVAAEGGGWPLYKELGFIPNEKGWYSPEAHEAVRKESNARARKSAIDKWNGKFGGTR